jgi:hypothetical protein
MTPYYFIGAMEYLEGIFIGKFPADKVAEKAELLSEGMRTGSSPYPRVTTVFTA